MKATHSFTVRPSLPPELSGLFRLAQNLRWSWDRRTRQLFAWADPDLWQRVHQDPIGLLANIRPERLAELSQDNSFLAAVSASERDLDAYLTQGHWFQARQATTASQLRGVAYFSPEFGISEALPQYSGGLGVLAGDHLKAASDLGVPIVGMGLFYRHGYFRQALSSDGWQQERYPDLDPWTLAIERCDGVQVTVDLGGEPCRAQIWRADVGRVRLYLLDTDVAENPAHLRVVTDRLYGGDMEHRLRQELILGIGGVRALRALGESAQLYHTNEGHAGFLSLERIRELIAQDGLSYPEAIEAARAGCLFTTHTPVPAGIDQFPRELIVKYFSGWAAECGVSIDDVVALGHRPGDQAEDRFNMAVMGLRLAARSNAVSRLHGEVSRDMFADLWPNVPASEIPITSITNGVHGSTWVSGEIDELLTKAVGPGWDAASSQEWDNVDSIPASEIWAARRVGMDRLVGFARERLETAELARGCSPSDVAWTRDAFDPDALTICFARRFATYKRANLLLSQPERLKALLSDNERPLQFLFAGKAHPADDAGKELIRQIVTFAHEAGIRHRFAFIDDYDMHVARTLYRGADVWLNTPRRPLEACGTSGEKAALNGALNCSILDGWWDEMFTGDNGWAVTSAEKVEDLDRRDRIEADSLFGLLEQQIVPLFYDRSDDGIAHGWVDRIRSGWRSLGPQVNAARMVRDYVTQLYEPLAARTERLNEDGHRRARQLLQWRTRIEAGWPAVAVIGVTGAGTEVAALGADRPVQAEVALGDLSPEDVTVQLLHGVVGEGDQLVDPAIEALTETGRTPTGTVSYAGSLQVRRAGRYGYTIRVVPNHPDLVNAIDLGRVVWAG